MNYDQPIFIGIHDCQYRFGVRILTASGDDLTDSDDRPQDDAIWVPSIHVAQSLNNLWRSSMSIPCVGRRGQSRSAEDPVAVAHASARRHGCANCGLRSWTSRYRLTVSW